jgi:hypothetical protein
MYCKNCGNQLSAEAQFCDNCGTPTGKNVPLSKSVHGSGEKNSSGTSVVRDGSIPWEIRGWNWGAFFLNWIWGLGNDTYIALLALIPIVNIVMIFVLGARGNEWAWRNGHWDSIEHFKAVQKRWAVASLIIFGISVAIMVLAIIVIIASSSSNSYQ